MRRFAVALVLVGVGLGACGRGSGPASASDQAYIAELQGAVPDIAGLRTSTQLERLGRAVCADLSAGASYQEVADRLALVPGAAALPSQDLGAVITAAADNYCPKYRGRVS